MEDREEAKGGGGGKEVDAHKDGGDHKEDGVHVLPGLHIHTNTLWLLAAGALGAVAALGASKATNKLRPAAVGAVKEGYKFKEWLGGKYEQVKEDVEDIVAEGVHQYHGDLDETEESIKRQKELLEKAEARIKAQRAKAQKEG
jgi:hypothetical protein